MTADSVITNGRIYTVDPARPWAEAVAWRDGRIIAVGSNTDIEPLMARPTRRIDAGGRLVLPGLTDAHVHFLPWAIRRHQLSLFGLTDLAAVGERVRAATAALEPGQWLIGWGWDSNSWERQPTAALLDAWAPHNPAVLARMDMHTWWVNSAVLDIAGVTVATPDPPESHIGRDADGQPNGLFSEWNALALIEPHIPEPDEATLLRQLREGIAEANRLGLTGIHDQRVEREGRQSLRLFQRLHHAGELKLRVHCNVAADYVAEAAQIGLAAGFGDDRLWLGHMKAFADGTMGSRTAAMLEPFDGEAGNTGVTVTGADELWRLIVAASETGFPISIHAIGDRAVRETLDVMGEWQTTAGARAQLTMPQRIEHVQLIHPSDLPRLAAHGIVASVQPVHLQTDWPTADVVWGERARYAYAFRSLLDQGAALAFGSDAPVAPLDPLQGIHAAVTRQDSRGLPSGGWYPQEKLTIAEAVAGYTTGPARLSGKADRLGSVTPGKYADFVVLSQNLFAIDPASIAATSVWLTVFDGDIVHQA